MASKTKWGAVKDHVTSSPIHYPDTTLEANLENADPELCVRLLQVGEMAATPLTNLNAFWWKVIQKHQGWQIV